MYSKKLNAVQLHQFIKENLHENCVSVDLRKTEFDTPTIKYAHINIKGENIIEPNIIVFNDEHFCISTSNKTKSEKLSNLSGEEINKLWQQFLYATFGKDYLVSKESNKEACK